MVDHVRHLVSGGGPRRRVNPVLAVSRGPVLGMGETHVAKRYCVQPTAASGNIGGPIALDPSTCGSSSPRVSRGQAGAKLRALINNLGMGLLLALFLLFWCSEDAHAAFPATQTNPTACTVAPCYNWSAGYGYFATPTAAAQSWVANHSSYSAVIQTVADTSFTWNSPVYPQWGTTTQGLTKVSVNPVAATYSCPATAALSGSMCTCIAPNTQNAAGTGCDAPNLCKTLVGNFAGNYTGSGKTGTKTYCDGGYTLPMSGDPALTGCVISGNADAAWQNADGSWTWGAGMSYTGDKCDYYAASQNGGANSGSKSDPTSCPAGQHPGTVNGTLTCYTPSNTAPKETSSNTKSQTTNPDGTTTNYTTNTTNNCNATTCTTTTSTTQSTSGPSGPVSGPTTTTSTSTCDRNTPGCSSTATSPSAPITRTDVTYPSSGPPTTTTTTSTTTGGGAGGSGSDMAGYCADHPTAAACKQQPDSTWSGACGAPPSCSGDAVMCEIAVEQFKRNCQTLEPDTNTGSTVNQALSGADGQNTDTLKANRSIVNVGSFDQSGRGWSRSCPQDPAFTLPWASASANQFVLPFSKVCGPLGLLSNVAVAVTLLGCLVFCIDVKKAG